ncbi:hypothetical protein ACFQZE_23885 [Paenibacillus sp. GCM10027627]|uniref:hypothetical protein n=1 Tax=unclassified Paenibacillus TaxID=185978 RepID=UPI003643DC64
MIEEQSIMNIKLIEACSIAVAAQRIGNVIHLLDMAPIHKTVNLRGSLYNDVFLGEVLKQLNYTGSETTCTWICYHTDLSITILYGGNLTIIALNEANLLKASPIEILPDFWGMMYAMHRSNQDICPPDEAEVAPSRIAQGAKRKAN